MRCATIALLAAGLLGTAVPALAQQTSKSQKRERPQANRNSESPRNRVQRGFEANSPKLGDRLPDATGYTADGSPISLRSLRGQYTVIVFGCLT